MYNYHAFKKICNYRLKIQFFSVAREMIFGGERQETSIPKGVLTVILRYGFL